MPRIARGRFTVKAVYDFAVDGGAVSSIALRGGVVPQGATVLDSWLSIITPLASATATAALQVESAADVQAAVAVTGAPWSTAGSKRGSASAGQVLPLASVDRAPTLVVGTAVLTAGKFELYLACADPSG
jgi:hypothetical protein